jgi:cyclase
MNRLLCLVFPILLITIVMPPEAVAQHDVDFDTVSVRPVQLTESVYVLYGYGGNIGLSVGNDGPFIVDDQFEQISDALRTTISGITEQPIQFVVNSHWHYDHSDGNKALGSEGAIIIAHENSRTRMDSVQVLSVSEYRQEPYPTAALPKVTFDESIRFHWNDDTIEVFHAPNAHTDGDAIVWFKEANAFHMGDVFVTYGFPYIDHEHGGNLNGIISACEKVIDMADDETWFIPGHGSPSRKSDVIAYVTMLSTMRSRVADLIDEGKSLDEIITLDPGKEIEGIGSSEQAVRWTYDAVTKRGSVR